MRFIIYLFLIFFSSTLAAQTNAVDAVADSLNQMADTANTVVGTGAALDNVAHSPENIEAAYQTGNKKKAATAIRQTARNIDSAAAGLSALSGTNVDASNLTDAMRDTSSALVKRANTEAAANATVKSAQKLGTAVENHNLSGMASAVNSLNSNYRRTVRNMGKELNDSKFRAAETKEISNSLKGISSRLRGAAQTQKNIGRISKSADKIKNGIKTGNLSGIASGLKSMAKNVKSTQKSVQRAATGSTKSPSSKSSSSSSSSGSGKSGGSSGSANSSNGGSSGSGKSGGSSGSANSNSGGSSGSGKSGGSTGSGKNGGTSNNNTSGSGTGHTGGSSGNNSNNSSGNNSNSSSSTSGNHNYNTGSDTLNNLLKKVEVNKSEESAKIRSRIPDVTH